MNVHYTARHLLLPPELKTYADKRLGGLGRLLEASAEVDLVVSAEKNRLRAEIQIRSKRNLVLVTEEGHDLSAVLNEAFDALEKKLKKEREKFREKKRRSGRERAALGLVDEAASLPPKVIRAEYFSAKPMSVADALVEFNLRKKDVLMFRTLDDDQWAVLFRRKDGSYGLVRPE
jgi:putative sigma-54 modulation protein